MNTKTTSVLQSGQRARQLAALMNELGLVRPPFPATPDWESYFLSPRLEERMDDLISSLAMRRGVVLVTVEVGVGKTTLTRLLVEHLRREGTSAALVINTVSSRGVDLLRTILIDFGLQARGETPGELLAVLNAYLLQQHSRDGNCVLNIDDAQALDVPSLELIRQICPQDSAQWGSLAKRVSLALMAMSLGWFMLASCAKTSTAALRASSVVAWAQAIMLTRSMLWLM